MSSILIIIAVGIGIASLVAFATTTLIPGQETTSTEDRLAAMASRRGGPAVKADQPSLLMAGGLDDTKNIIDELLKSMPALGEYLSQADIALSPAKFSAIVLACFIGGTAVVATTPVPILLAPIAGAMVSALPLMWLMFKRKRRLAKFGRQMPEALELLGRSLRAGHSLANGFGLVGSEMDEPISKEFRRVFEEQNFGIPLEEALEDLSDRIPNMDLRFFATAIILQRTTGGDLSEILDKIGHLVRERLQILGQVQALTGEGRLSGIVLLAMPPALFLFMLKLNPEYVMQLFNDELGHYMLGIAIVTQIIGALVIKKIITIKV
ncbi:MAG: type II secretion system F family protein [Planctomycetaceae bacterium]